MRSRTVNRSLPSGAARGRRRVRRGRPSTPFTCPWASTPLPTPRGVHQTFHPWMWQVHFTNPYTVGLKWWEIQLGWQRNIVLKKFRGIDSEWFPLFGGRKCSFRSIPSSAEEPIPKLGTERNWRENGRGNPHICTELLRRHQSDSSQDILWIAK